MAVLSVLELPNMRTTKETNAESLAKPSSGTSPAEAGGVRAGADALCFGGERLGAPDVEKHRIECEKKGPTLGSSMCDVRGLTNCSSVEELMSDGCGGSVQMTSGCKATSRRRNARCSMRLMQSLH